MMVSWVTLDQAGASWVQYGQNRSLALTAKGEGPYPFRDGGSEHRTIWMHKVMLTSLTPGDSYRE